MNAIAIIVGGSAIVMILAIAYIFIVIVSNQRIIEAKNSQLVEIERRERRYRDLFEHSLVGMMRFNFLTWEIDDANPELLRIFESDGLTALSMRLNNLSVTARHVIQKNLEEEGKIVDYEMMIHSLSGDRVWVLFSAKRAEDRHFARAVIIDITDRKRIEETIEEQAQLLNDVHDAIIVVSREGTIVFWNESAEEVYHWKKEEVLGQDLGRVIYPEGRIDSYELALSECHALGTWRGTCNHLTRESKEILIDSQWKQVTSKYFGRKIILIVNSDITEKRKAELRYLRTQKLESIALLTGGIAHDLQNILAPTAMTVSLLRADPTNPNNYKLLDAVDENTKNGMDLLNRILVIGKGTKGDKARLDIARTVDDSLKAFELARGNGITIGRNYTCGSYFVLGNAQQLQQVFSNLFANAGDAMIDGGSLDVCIRPAEDSIEVLYQYPDYDPDKMVDIAITDTGKGISEEHLATIFDPFFTTKSESRGTGLGLAIVQNIIQSHNGLVTVESTHSVGTTFHVFLPTIS